MSPLAKRTLHRLKGPAANRLVLVLSEELTKGRDVPEVVAAPALLDVNRVDATIQDVYCPADSSPLGKPLVIAAWATAAIAIPCIGERVGEVNDSAVLDAIRDVRLALVDPTVVPNPQFVGTRSEAPNWHGDVRTQFSPYWDGSAVERCREPARAYEPELSRIEVKMRHGSGAWAVLSDLWQGVQHTLHRSAHAESLLELGFTDEDVLLSELTLSPPASLEFFRDSLGQGYIVRCDINVHRMPAPPTFVARSSLESLYSAHRSRILILHETVARLGAPPRWSGEQRSFSFSGHDFASLQRVDERTAESVF